MQPRTERRLTSKKIYDERPDIEKFVYDKHPVTKSEMKCTTEKAQMEWLRFMMAKKIYEGEKSIADYETK
jgi:hypothetical protein